MAGAAPYRAHMRCTLTSSHLPAENAVLPAAFALSAGDALAVGAAVLPVVPCGKLPCA